MSKIKDYNYHACVSNNTTIVVDNNENTISYVYETEELCCSWSMEGSSVEVWTPERGEFTLKGKKMRSLLRSLR